MNSTPNHECQICGEKYYACNKCDQINNWRQVSCSPKCYQIYLIITQFKLSIINKEESIDLFNNIGLTMDTINNYQLNEDVKTQILNIIKVEDNEIETIITAKKTKK